VNTIGTVHVRWTNRLPCSRDVQIVKILHEAEFAAADIDFTGETETDRFQVDYMHSQDQNQCQPVQLKRKAGLYTSVLLYN
jgi:hypothetical protein